MLTEKCITRGKISYTPGARSLVQSLPRDRRWMTIISALSSPVLPLIWRISMRSCGSSVSLQRLSITRSHPHSMSWHRSIRPPILQPTTTSLRWRLCRRLPQSTVLFACSTKSPLRVSTARVSTTTGLLQPMQDRICSLPAKHPTKTRSFCCSFAP